MDFKLYPMKQYFKRYSNVGLVIKSSVEERVHAFARVAHSRTDAYQEETMTKALAS